MPQSYEEIDSIFKKDGYELAKHLLGASITEEKLHQLTQTVYENLDNLVNSFIARLKQELQPLDCKKGCSWCCTQPVFLSNWEAAYLRKFIKKRFTLDRIVLITGKANDKNDEISGLPREEMLKKRIPCPLLHENICSVYPARPAACRIYLSSNLDSCVEEFRHPSNQENFAMLYDFPLHAGRKINEGIAQWLEENSYPVKELRLEEGILEKE